jgi:hypothetical protein
MVFKLIKRLLGNKTYEKLKPLRKNVLKHRNTFIRQFLKGFNILGLNVYPVNSYYSPLPVLRHLEKNKHRWARPSALAGVNFDIEKFKSLFVHLQQYIPEYTYLLPYKEATQIGFGPGYTYVDSITSYTMIRDIKPNIYFEIGSGLSTYYASLALNKNKVVDQKSSRIICVEPYPYQKLKDIDNITLYQQQVQDVSVDQFNVLEENDILFIDSTHVLRIDSDVAYLYLEVLPQLKKGVYIHIHDIAFPFNIPYPYDYWILKRDVGMYWTEAMLLQALLCHSDTFEIVLSTPLIRHYDEPFLRKNIPDYKGVEEDPNAFSSIWLKKIK